MPIPLPDKILNNISENAPNLSLKYYKRADVYQDQTFTKILKDKMSFFYKFIELSSKQDYKKAYTIRERLLEGTGISFAKTTASRLLCGMGYEHPLENGFMFDWTSGLPVIPGSSLKGATLAAANTLRKYGSDDEKMLIFDTKTDKQITEKICDIFGDVEICPKVKAGDIVFFPAYPCLDDGQKFLDLDVMTPHYQPYYSEPQKNPPADWYSPNPVHFLTVPAGIKYCFRLSNRRNLKDTMSDLLMTAGRILAYALTEFGVGAKTNVFYGYFK